MTYLTPPPPPDQGLIADMVSELFEIQHGYFGTVLSNLARVSRVSCHGYHILQNGWVLLYCRYTWRVQRNSRMRSTWLPGLKPARGTTSLIHLSAPTLVSLCIHPCMFVYMFVCCLATQTWNLNNTMGVGGPLPG